MFEVSTKVALSGNQVRISLPAKTDNRRNHDAGAPAHTAMLAQNWIATNCSDLLV